MIEKRVISARSLPFPKSYRQIQICIMTINRLRLIMGTRLVNIRYYEWKGVIDEIPGLELFSGALSEHFEWF